jgi:hypothetical protein
LFTRLSAGMGLGPKRLSTLVAVAALAATGVTSGAVTTSAALAVSTHQYCENFLAHGATCPPEGSSKQWHLLENWGWTTSGAGEACIDEHEGSSFTSQTCAVGPTQIVQYPGGVLGFPRVWQVYAPEPTYGVEVGE